VHRTSGFTVVEMLLAIAIVGILAAALVAAINASFMAYSTSTETASMQTAGRLVMQRTLNMIRTSSLHDAYDPGDPNKTLLKPTDNDHPLKTIGIQMVTDAGPTVKIWWALNGAYGDDDLGDLWYQQDSQTPQALIERVACQRSWQNDPYVFTLASRTSTSGLLLARATLDLDIHRDPAAVTGLEAAASKTGGIRLIGSTMPRRNLD
jgi:prepilin-type N-terminal cleavage/methylation domain-containing protein